MWGCTGCLTVPWGSHHKQIPVLSGDSLQRDICVQAASAEDKVDLTSACG